MTLLWLLLGAGIAWGIGWWMTRHRKSDVSSRWMQEQDRSQWREGNADAICWNWDAFKNRELE